MYILSFFDKNEISNNAQFGFRPGRDTENVTATCLCNLLKDLENKHIAAEVLLIQPRHSIPLIITYYYINWIN